MTSVSSRNQHVLHVKTDDFDGCWLETRTLQTLSRVHTRCNDSLPRSIRWHTRCNTSVQSMDCSAFANNPPLRAGLAPSKRSSQPPTPQRCHLLRLCVEPFRGCDLIPAAGSSPRERTTANQLGCQTQQGSYNAFVHRLSI